MNLKATCFFTPHWMNGGDLFWYRRELPNGHEDVVIDARTGKRAVTFDAPRGYRIEVDHR